MMGSFVRLGETARPAISITVDGQAVSALSGDTLLVAMRVGGKNLRQSEFGDGPRAGFCLMGACQDCWVTTTAGQRLRACSSVATDGMSIVTKAGEPLPYASTIAEEA